MSKRQVPFAAGDHVTFKDGVFAGFDADVVDVDTTERMIYVDIPLFGSKTPVELSFDEAARILVLAVS